LDRKDRQGLRVRWDLLGRKGHLDLQGLLAQRVRTVSREWQVQLDRQAQLVLRGFLDRKGLQDRSVLLVPRDCQARSARLDLWVRSDLLALRGRGGSLVCQAFLAQLARSVRWDLLERQVLQVQLVRPVHPDRRGQPVNEATAVIVVILGCLARSVLPVRQVQSEARAIPARSDRKVPPVSEDCRVRRER